MALARPCDIERCTFPAQKRDTLIDLFFGGTGELEVKAEGRDFSAIEQRMIKRVVISALVWLAIASTLSGAGSVPVRPMPALSKITTR